jgi:hypothetical protein
MLWRKPVYLTCFALHFLLISTLSCRDTFWLGVRSRTIVPSSLKSWSKKCESVASAALGQNLAPSNPVRRAVMTYLHVAGIDRPYGYFAPNVPASYKLIFELHYGDGRVEYDVPHVNSAATGLRVASLLEEIGRTRDDALREYLVKMLARSTWREHPDVKTIRAILGSRNLPTIDEFERGARESYEFLYAYDFSLGKEPAQPTP